MKKVSVDLRSDGVTYYTFQCPGCGYTHSINTMWAFNNDVENPTFTPSILVNKTEVHFRCHSFITDGKIQFLADCTHNYASQTLELGEIGKEDDWR